MKPSLGGGRALVALALIALAAFALWERLRGIGMMLPYATESVDEHIAFRQLQIFRGAEFDPREDPFYGLYPHVLSRTAWLLPTDGGGEERPGMGLEEHLKRARAPWLELRAASALLSLGIVPGTYWLARAFLGAGWSLLAAAFAATSLLHAAYTQLVRPHGAVTTFVLLTVVAAIHLRRHPALHRYLLAGLAAGLAIGSLHSGIFALGPLLVAHVLRARAARGRSRWWILGSLGLVAASVWVFYPFHFQAPAHFLGLEETARGTAFNLSGQPLFLEEFNGAGFRVIAWTLATYDPLLLVLASAGLAIVLVGLVRRPPGQGTRLDLAVALAHAVPYTVVIGLYAGTWERFLLQLLPYAGILAAAAVRALASSLAPSPSPRAAGLSIALGVLLLALPAAGVHRLGTVRGAADTQQLAADWIRSHLDPGKDRVLAVPILDLPLLQSAEALRRNAPMGASPWVEYQAGLSAELGGAERFDLLLPGEIAVAQAEIQADARAWLAASRANYVLVASGPADAAGPAMHRLRYALAGEADRVARFSTERIDRGEDTTFPYGYYGMAWTPPLLLRVFEAERMGRTLEMYRLR